MHVSVVETREPCTLHCSGMKFLMKTSPKTNKRQTIVAHISQLWDSMSLSHCLMQYKDIININALRLVVSGLILMNTRNTWNIGEVSMVPHCDINRAFR